MSDERASNIPKKFKLKGKLWKVTLRKQPLADGVECRGMCDFDQRRIFLKKSNPDQEQVDIFLHELVHAAIYEAHLNSSSGLTTEAEEIVCDAMADMIQTLLDFTWKKGRK